MFEDFGAAVRGEHAAIFPDLTRPATALRETS